MRLSIADSRWTTLLRKWITHRHPNIRFQWTWMNEGGTVWLCPGYPVCIDRNQMLLRFYCVEMAESWWYDETLLELAHGLVVASNNYMCKFDRVGNSFSRPCKHILIRTIPIHYHLGWFYFYFHLSYSFGIILVLCTSIPIDAMLPLSNCMSLIP